MWHEREAARARDEWADARLLSTAIDSVENDLTAYWIYSVNDSTPGVASDKYLVSPGDTVRWHLRRTTPTP